MRWFGKISLAIVLSLSLLLHSMAFNAQPVQATWYSDTDYQYRKKLTIDSAKVSGTADLSHFPILVSYSDPDLRTTGDGGHVTDPNGWDIIFTGDNKTTKLDHEKESYSSNETTGTIVMWVRIPTLDYDDDTDIYIYYGNSNISTSQENITGVWNENGANNYKGVWHLKETSGTHYDSTANDADSTSVSVTTQGSAGGQIDGADEFVATSSDFVGFGQPASLNLTGEMSGFAWVRFDNMTNNQAIFAEDSSSGNNAAFGLVMGYVDYRLVARWGGEWIASSNTDLSTGTYYVGFTRTGSAGDWTVNFYVGGDPDGTTSSITENPGTQENFSIGRPGDVSSGYYFDGIVDEVRLSNKARGAGWIKTCYNNQANQGTGTGKFIKTLGSEEEIPELLALFIPVALATPAIVKYLKRKKKLSVISEY